MIPHISDRVVGELAEEPLVVICYNPSPLYRGLVSCVGSDYCNMAVIETKKPGRRPGAGALGEGLKPITLHWSGCPAGVRQSPGGRYRASG